MEFKRKKLLTRPVLKMEQDKTRYVKLEGAMFVGKDIKPRNQADDEKKKEPATLVNAVNLEDGSLVLIVVNAVLKSVLSEEYPGDGYVGKCFAITKQGRQPGKQYNPFHIEEIEDPSGAATSAESSASVAVGKRR